MESNDFVDYYEILNLSPSANVEDIERTFRNLARKYHPDNLVTGNRSDFDLVIEAHNTLRNRKKRAAYHEDYKYQLSARWGAVDDVFTAEPDGSEAGRDREGVDSVGIERDVDIQNKLLTLLYVKRRTNIKEPGIGDAELERLSGCSPDHLEFHLWYLKEKGWIRRAEDGLLTITIEGVDRATLVHQDEYTRMRILDQR